MKAIKIRPFQRPLLAVLSLTTLTGCSGLQPELVYRNLEQKVQHVYNVTAPIQQQGIVPALFKTVSVPGIGLLKKPIMLRANYRPQLQAPTSVINEHKPSKPSKQNAKESSYIEQFYGL